MSKTIDFKMNGYTFLALFAFFLQAEMVGVVTEIQGVWSVIGR